MLRFCEMAVLNIFRYYRVKLFVIASVCCQPLSIEWPKDSQTCGRFTFSLTISLRLFEVLLVKPRCATKTLLFFLFVTWLKP